VLLCKYPGFRRIFDAFYILLSCYTVLNTAQSVACHRHYTSSVVKYVVICNTQVGVFHMSLLSVTGSKVKLIRTKEIVASY